MTPPPISTPILAFFRHIVRRYFRRHFRAVRVSHPQRFASLTGPLIVFANHSSWWDPMVSTLLAAELMPYRPHYAPMDAAALDRYRILRRIGIFPVEPNTPRGAAHFLRTSLSILETNGILWITPQGRFADPRQRPLDFKPGLAALAARAPAGTTLLPLAIEYPFWDERLPETLLHFGTPIAADASTLQPQLESALLETMHQLELLSLARDPRAFTLLRRGSSGSGGIYALIQRLRATLRRQPWQPDHTPHPPVQE